jgi:MFS family permease
MQPLGQSVGQSVGESSLPPDAAPGPDRRWLIFGIVSVALLMASIDQTIVATALPAIQSDLHAQINWSGWTITIYSLGQLLVMPLAGRISDQYGRRKVFIFAVVVFTTASLCCGLANDIYVLVGLRAVQSLGGGAFMPSASGIVSDHFGKDRDRALGFFASIFPIGALVGPVIGGIFVAQWSWRGIFLVNVPVGIVLVALSLKFLPTSIPRPARRVDVRGVLLLGLFILSAMFGIAFLGSGGVRVYSPAFLGPELIAVLAGWLFLRHASRDPAPFIPIRLLRGRGFGAINVLNLWYGSVALGFGALVPLYAEQRYGIKPLAAGTLLSARAIGVIALSSLAVLALRRTGYRLPILVGYLMMAGGLVLMSISPPVLSAYTWLGVGAGLTGVGMGLCIPAANNAIMYMAPDDVAAISGLRGMFRQAGSITAVSITTAVLAQSSNPGITQAHIFWVLAVIGVLTLPLILRVPEHRGSW